MSTPATLKDTDEVAENEQMDKTGDCLDAHNVQPLAPPPMPPMLNFFDSDFSLNPTPTQSQNEGDCDETTGDAVDETTAKDKPLIQYSDSDDADDCPVFEYSVESMEVATESEQQKETTETVETVAVSNNTQVENSLHITKCKQNKVVVLLPHKEDFCAVACFLARRHIIYTTIPLKTYKVHSGECAVVRVRLCVCGCVCAVIKRKIESVQRSK